MHGVTIITSTIKPQFMDNVFQNYTRQKWESKELIIILNKDDMDINRWKQEAEKYQNVSVYQLSEEITLGKCLNYGIDQSQYRYVAKFDDDDYYGEDYLTQSMEAFEKTDAAIVGKRTIYMYFENEKVLTLCSTRYENQFTKKILKGGTIVLDKTYYPSIHFPDTNLGEDVGIQRQCIEKGLKMYATDRRNFSCVRHDDSIHTSHKANEKLLKVNKFIAYTEDFRPYLSMKKQIS
jgi:hypothetical protein